MIVLLLALTPVQATAEAPVLTVAPTVFADDRLAAPATRLVWPDDAHLQVEDGADEIVVRFDRPLPQEQISAFRDAAGSGIDDLRWNDDTLVLRAATGWRMTWRQVGTMVSVTFIAPATASLPIAAADDDAARDAAIVGIEADAAAGYAGQARRAAEALANAHPADRRLARLRADTRISDGDIRGAAREYRALGATDRTARRAIAAAPGTASIGIIARDGDDMKQAEFGLRADVAIDDRFAAGGGVRHIFSTVEGVPRAGDTMVDASLTATMLDTVRIQLLASAALDDAVTGGRAAGGGAKLVMGSAEAQLRATVTAHMPDLSTPAQVVGGGYLSRALFGVTYRLTPGVVVQADGGANRYGLAGVGRASDTWVASAGVDYLIRRQFPALGLTYRYEAEYVQRMRNSAGGLPLIPLASRENHTMQGLVSGSAGVVQMTALAGWTVDRFGGDGPTASVGVAAPIGIGWRIEGSGGITSVSRPGFTGQQIYARALVTRSLGDAR